MNRHEDVTKKEKGDSLEKMLSLLDYFTEATPIRSSEELIELTGTSRSTGYRYIKLLVRSGLLSPVSNGSYILGSRILEMDLLIRTCDPIYRAGDEVLGDLVKKTEFSAFLSVLYTDAVMCVRSLEVPSAPRGMFQRGQRKSLFLGAASRIILAHLPHHQLKVVFDRGRAEIEKNGLGGDWSEFLKTLRSYRAQGYCVSSGEFRPNVAGVAAPIFNDEGKILGSVAVGMKTEELLASETPKLGEVVLSAAAKLSETLASAESALTRPARAVG